MGNISNGKVITDDLKYIDSVDPALLLKSGDLLYNRTNSLELIGKVGLFAGSTDLPTSFASYLVRLRTVSESLPAYCAYLLNTEGILGLARANAFVAIGQCNLNPTRYGMITVAVPPKAEQIRIAGFLDQETAKIDELIAEQQRLIELLKEKRQAVISHAVTKGLNPHAPTKPSGIEWIGDVPAHWEVTRLGNLFHEVADPGSDELPVLTVSIHHGVSDKEVAEEEMDRKVARIDDRSKYKRVRSGDLVYNMMRAWQGGFGTVTVDGMVSPAYVVARPRKSLETAYIENLLRTPQAIEQMRRHSQGVTDFRLRLYWDEFKNIRVALPPQGEAKAICAHIDEMEKTFRDMTAVSSESIDLLQERRSALISAAVTGQIDVRHLAENKIAA
ncbi:hypothetical protein ACXR0O_07840 [Verrucomicrobiota bacterium sgz303538]